MSFQKLTTAILTSGMVLGIAWSAAGGQHLSERNRPAAATPSRRRMSLSRLGYADGLPLEGSTASVSASFPLPRGVRVLRGDLALKLDVTKTVVPGSNLQVFVNGTRRLVIPRTADASPEVNVRVPLMASDLARETVEVQVRSYLAVGRDRCIDERLGSAYATMSPESSLEYEYDPASVRSPQAVWALLPDTVHVILPNRALTPAEFALAYELGLELRADGRTERYARSPEGGALTLDSTAVIRALVAWRRLVSRRDRSLPEDPTLEQMGITDLTRLYGYRGTWRLPIDLRTLQPDRVPSAVELTLASAPSAFARGVQYFVYLNGTLLRAFVGTEDGRSQLLHVDLPQYLLTTYNEVRVDVQRHRDPADYCQEAEALYPAQILGSSVLRTTHATNEPRLFTGTALRLPDGFPLYLPRAALSSAEVDLPAIVSLARGLWGNRAPRVQVYDRAEEVRPDEGFVAVGSLSVLKSDGPARVHSGRMLLRGPAIGEVDLGLTAEDALVVQVARVNGHAGIVAALPQGVVSLPDGPEGYGNANVIVQSPGATVLRVNTESVPAEALYGNFGWVRRWAWSTQLIVGIAFVVLLVAALLYVAWHRANRRRKVRAAA